MPTYKSPGVYPEDVVIKPKSQLPTGVPVFIGFAESILDQPVALYRKEEFQSSLNSLPFGQSYLADAVNGFFDNGGVYCYVMCADSSVKPKDALITAIDKTSYLNDVDLVSVPDCMVLEDPEDVFAIQRKMLSHCAINAGRFALLDSLGPKHVSAQSDIVEVIKKQKREVIDMAKLAPDPSGTISNWTIDPSANGSLYFPWVKTLSTGDEPVPPCGHIAGIYARSDLKGGVSKAPANEELLGVFDLERDVTSGIQDELNPEGINCLRAFPGRGLRVWGARTLCQDESWRYVNVRRLFLTLSRWIEVNLSWAAFEPNTPLLWIRISRELTVYLTKLWKSGALCGDKPDQAFFVKCDTETNPAENIEAGEVITQIGLAPAVPAEFIIVRVIHRAGTTEIS